MFVLALLKIGLAFGVTSDRPILSPCVALFAAGASNAGPSVDLTNGERRVDVELRGPVAIGGFLRRFRGLTRHLDQRITGERCRRLARLKPDWSLGARGLAAMAAGGVVHATQILDESSDLGAAVCVTLGAVALLQPVETLLAWAHLMRPIRPPARTEVDHFARELKRRITRPDRRPDFARVSLRVAATEDLYRELLRMNTVGDISDGVLLSAEGRPRPRAWPVDRRARIHVDARLSFDETTDELVLVLAGRLSPR